MTKKQLIIKIVSSILVIFIVGGNFFLYSYVNNHHLNEEKENVNDLNPEESTSTFNHETQNLDEIGKKLAEFVKTYNLDQLDLYEQNINVTTKMTSQQLITMIQYFRQSNETIYNGGKISKIDVDNYLKKVYNVVSNDYPDILCVLDNSLLYHYDKESEAYLPDQINEHLHKTDKVTSLSYSIIKCLEENGIYTLKVKKLYGGEVTRQLGYFADAKQTYPLLEFEQFIERDTEKYNIDKAIRYYENNKDNFVDIGPVYTYQFKMVNDEYYLIDYKVNLNVKK